MLHLYCFEECYRIKQKGGMRCPICQDSDDPEDKPNQLLLGCGHSICEKCYNDMKFVGRTTCPLCNGQIDTNNILVYFLYQGS